MITKEKTFILFFLILGPVVALSTSLNHLDSNIHLDYVRAIQDTGSIPVYHPHLYGSDVSQVPLPYPIGYHLAMAAFPHWVPLYKILEVVFAAVSLVLVIKLHQMLGFGKNLAVIVPLVLAFSFSKFTITPHPDMFALMLILLSVYATVKYISGEKLGYAALAIGTGFYACMTREIALMTLFFAWVVLWLRYTKQRKRLFQTIVPIVIFAGMGYYWVNCVVRGVSLLYPLRGAVDPQAYGWYSSHVSFWNVLAHGYWLQVLGTIIGAFSVFLPLFFLKPQDRTLALVFGCQIALIFIVMPSTAGLDRYVMFTLPFLAIAYGNVFKNPKRWLPVLLVGTMILYPAQGILLHHQIHDDFGEVTQHLDQNDFVLGRQWGQAAYRVGCRAGWTSLFWSGDLYDTFENVEKLENFVTKHGVTHVLIDKGLIIQANGTMIGNEAVGYPEDWVAKVENIGTKIDGTEHYILYQV